MRTLSMIRTDFIEFLRLVFSEGKVKANGQTIFRWDPDDKKTKILIKGSKVTNPETLNKSPAILVSRGDVKPDNNTKGIGSSILSHDWTSGYSTHGYVMGGPVIFNCICPNEEEAEALAQILYTVIEKNMPYLREKYKYRMIILGGIGKPRILKYEGEGTKVEAWNCGVVAQVMFHFGYKYKQELNGIGELNFPFFGGGSGSGGSGGSSEDDDGGDTPLRPPIAWLDQEE